jgi:hypothetical protein
MDIVSSNSVCVTAPLGIPFCRISMDASSLRIGVILSRAKRRTLSWLKILKIRVGREVNDEVRTAEIR